MQPNFFILLQIFTVLILIGLSGYGWKQRSTPAARPFALVMLLCATWALEYTLNIASPLLESKIILSKIQVTLLAVLPVALLAMALEFIIVVDGQAYEVVEGASASGPIALPPTQAPQPTTQPVTNPTPVGPQATPLSPNSGPAKTPAAPTQCLGAAMGMVAMTLVVAGVGRKKKVRR